MGLRVGSEHNRTLVDFLKGESNDDNIRFSTFGPVTVSGRDKGVVGEELQIRMRRVEVMMVLHQANSVWSGGFFNKDLTVCFSGKIDPGNRIVLLATCSIRGLV